MRKANIITWRQYFWYAKEWRSKSKAWLVVAVAAVALLWMGPFMFSQENYARYYLWRLEKGNATAVDRARAIEAYSRLLTASPNSEFQRIGRSLRYEALPVETAERLIGILIENRAASSSGIQSFLIPALRAANPDTRARVQAALADIAMQQNICLPAALSKWKPSRSDSATQIDEHMKEWQTAWNKGPNATACE
jgi:hypothetical protein